MKRRRIRLRRGAYLLPSALTIGSAFCGFWSVIGVLDGRYERSAWLILASFLLDGLDGRVARLTRTTSRFGEEFDSLADIIAFGMAPALLAYAWGLQSWDRIGWLCCFLFMITGGARLARFNIQAASQDKRYFVGLPIPAAAGVIAGLVLFLDGQPIVDRFTALPVLILVLVTGFLMISKVRYRSFKDLNLKRRYPFWWVLLPALLLFLVFSHPQLSLLTVALTYAASGPLGKAISWVRQRHRLRRQRRAIESQS